MSPYQKVGSVVLKVGTMVCEAIIWMPIFKMRKMKCRKANLSHRLEEHIHRPTKLLG
jgi:hypothetical protein